MNKLTKIGVSALCGSLAAVASANAGEITVKGGATATWSSNEGEVTGNPIGLSSGMTFTGSGELDNGTTFALTLTHTDQSAYSTGQISLTTPGMGTWYISQSGGGIDRVDDMMPTAWEEVDGTSLGMGLQTVAGNKGSAHVEWAVPTDMLPDGLTAHVLWTPRASGTKQNDKGVGGDGSGAYGQGWDIALQHSGLVDGLNVFAGYATTETAAAAATSDKTEKTIGATYAVGSVTVGYQYAEKNLQSLGAAVVSRYENDAYGISFSVNDDLSISYGVHKSDQQKTNGTSVELDGQSLQMAYSMGGATIKIAETEGDNLKYNSATDRGATTLALTLAF
jgi:outer membrane protein OmpU